MNGTMRRQRCLTPMMTLLGGLLVASIACAQRPQVEIRTTKGNFVVELFNETPAHRDNFLKHVEQGDYEGLLFDRVVPGLMVQGGDPKSRAEEHMTTPEQSEAGYTLEAEILPGAIHRKGAMAAVRAPDDVNPEKRSDGSRFFLVMGKPYAADELVLVNDRARRNGIDVRYTEAQQRIYAELGGAPHLDGNYTVFGQVIEGFDVLNAIAAVECDGQDRPRMDILMYMRSLK